MIGRHAPQPLGFGSRWSAANSKTFPGQSCLWVMFRILRSMDANRNNLQPAVDEGHGLRSRSVSCKLVVILAWMEEQPKHERPGRTWVAFGSLCQQRQSRRHCRLFRKTPREKAHAKTFPFLPAGRAALAKSPAARVSQPVRPQLLALRGNAGKAGKVLALGRWG
jgi:hypothetical protein